MTIVNLAALKLVQRVSLPSDVEAVNVFYMDCAFTDDQTDEDVRNNCVVWINALYATILDELSDLVSLGEMTLYVWNAPLLQWDNKGTGAPTGTGTETTSMLPHGVAALVRAYSTEPRTIGRKYIPGFGEIEQEDGEWVAGALTALAEFGVEWSTSKEITAGNVLYPAIWSTKYKAAYRLSGTEVVLVNAAYQRRRRPGVGS